MPNSAQAAGRAALTHDKATGTTARVAAIGGWRQHRSDEPVCPHVAAAVDLAWLEAAAGSRDKLRLFTDHEGTDLVGVAAFRSTDTHIRVAAGPLPLYSARIQRFYAIEQPRSNRAAQQPALIACLTTLADCTPRGSAIYLDAISADSDLGALLAAPPAALRARWYVLPWGAAYEHCKIKWTGSVEAYLNSLTSKNRSNMKRPARKIETAGVRLRLQRFQSPGDVNAFLTDGTRISDKTYQRRRLGSGLTRGGNDEALMRFAATRGGFLAHVLYLDDQPVAFQYGLIRSTTFYGLEMGYDPAYSQLQVGNVLFLKMLEDIEKHSDAIDLIDMMTYDNVFKHRSANLRTAARNYYLFPRKGFAWATYAPVLMATRIRALAMSALSALDLKDRAKHWSRGRQRRPDAD